MEKIHFDEAIKQITAKDRRYKPEAYHFLREALDLTLSRLRDDELEEHRHVSGPELLNGTVHHAREEYGSMAVAVLESWGITEEGDIGDLVFNLIDTGAFGRSDDDSPEDFRGVLNLRDELLEPFRPTREVLAARRQDDGEPPARGNQPAKSKEV